MVFLDTHVALWLFAEPGRIPRATQEWIDENELFLSPMVRLEMSFLYEIGRLKEDPTAILGILERDLGAQVETAGWIRATEIATHLSWTRDPFDRLIVAHALAYGADLCSRDSAIRDNYSHAVWLEHEI